jgi:hypothetical protein
MLPQRFLSLCCLVACALALLWSADQTIVGGGEQEQLAFADKAQTEKAGGEKASAKKAPAAESSDETTSDTAETVLNQETDDAADDDAADADDDESASSRRDSSRDGLSRRARPQKITLEQSTPTHKQVREIKPALNDLPVTLETFCLAAARGLPSPAGKKGAGCFFCAALLPRGKTPRGDFCPV